MADCVQIPTATQTQVVSSTSFSTSFSLTTSTIPASVITSTVSESCTSTVSGSCVASVPVLTTTTIPASTTTITSPIVSTLEFTTTEFNTLFGTSCPPTLPPTSPTPDPPPDTNTTLSAPNTLPTGQSTVFVTQTSPPSTQTAGLSPDNGNNNQGSSTPAHLGAIIGGTVGGVVGIVAIVAIVWFVLKRRSRWDDIFDDGPTHHGERFSLASELDPKPYQYGLVGQHPTPNSPPATVTSLPTSEGYGVGYGPRNSDPTYGPGHARNKSSLAPLNMPIGPGGGATSGLTPSTMSTSRPSTAGSMQALNNPPGIRPTTPGNGYNTPFNPYVLPGPAQQQPFNPYALSTVPTPPSHSRATSSNTYHSNTGSITSPPLNPQNTWALNTATPPQMPANTPPLLPIGAAASIGAAAMASVDSIQRPSEDGNGQFSPQAHPERTGSPVSFREPMGLRIVNQRSSTLSNDLRSPSLFDSDAMSSIAEGSTTSRSASVGATTTSSRDRDGKGRLVMRNADGDIVVPAGSGTIPEEPSGSNGASGPAPPAYTA